MASILHFQRESKAGRLSKRNSSGKMYENVAPHAWSPSNFPFSEETAKCIRRLLTVEYQVRRSFLQAGRFEDWRGVPKVYYRPQNVHIGRWLTCPFAWCVPPFPAPAPA
jgi:hypothetical protein